MSFSLAVYGHKPVLSGDATTGGRLRGIAARWLARERPGELVSGLTSGWDLACARAALELGLPLIGVLAYPGQGETWPIEARNELKAVVAGCAEVVTLSQARAPGIWIRRDRWVLDRAQRVLALWDGDDDETCWALAYAEVQGKAVDNLWGEWEAVLREG